MSRFHGQTIEFAGTKGGAGTTVVAAATALRLAQRDGGTVYLHGDGHDLRALFGVAVPGGRPLDTGGVLWDDGNGRRVLFLGDGIVAGDEPTVRDVGRFDRDVARRPAWARQSSSMRVLVTRPCYMALSRYAAATTSADPPRTVRGAVLVEEDGRSLDKRDVADVLELPILAVLPVRPAVARSVDAGTFPMRTPPEACDVADDVLDYLAAEVAR